MITQSALNRALRARDELTKAQHEAVAAMVALLDQLDSEDICDDVDEA